MNDLEEAKTDPFEAIHLNPFHRYGNPPEAPPSGLAKYSFDPNWYGDGWAVNEYYLAWLMVIACLIPCATILGYANFFAAGGNTHLKNGASPLTTDWAPQTDAEKLKEHLLIIKAQSNLTHADLKAHEDNPLYLDAVLKDSGISNTGDRLKVINHIRAEEPMPSIQMPSPCTSVGAAASLVNHEANVGLDQL